MTTSSHLQIIKQELLPKLKSQAFTRLEKPITLASGKTSQVYFDGKQITLIPDNAVLFARGILELVGSNKIDAIGGPTLGADPIATAVSLMAYLDRGKVIPAFIVRKEPKKHGLQKLIEGYQLKKGDKVLMVEDVITSGKSVMEAIRVVESLGAEIAQIACLVDRKEGGAEALSKYHFTPLFVREEIEG